jgi:hypothetical protein
MTFLSVLRSIIFQRHRPCRCQSHPSGMQRKKEWPPVVDHHLVHILIARIVQGIEKSISDQHDVDLELLDILYVVSSQKDLLQMVDFGHSDTDGDFTPVDYVKERLLSTVPKYYWDTACIESFE